MKKIYVLGKKAFTLGFRLAGVRNIKWTDELEGKQIAELINKIISEEEVGLLIVEGEEFEKIPEKYREYFESLTFPMVIPFSEQFKSETLRKKIIQTIGIDLMR